MKQRSNVGTAAVKTSSAHHLTDTHTHTHTLIVWIHVQLSQVMVKARLGYLIELLFSSHFTGTGRGCCFIDRKSVWFRYSGRQCALFSWLLKRRKKGNCAGKMMKLLELWTRHPQLLRIYFGWWDLMKSQNSPEGRKTVMCFPSVLW